MPGRRTMTSIYDLHTGYINDLLMLPPGTHIDDIYQMEFDDVTPE